MNPRTIRKAGPQLPSAPGSLGARAQDVKHGATTALWIIRYSYRRCAGRAATPDNPPSADEDAVGDDGMQAPSATPAGEGACRCSRVRRCRSECAPLPSH
eukprot:4483429-Alexandrium_andersonii.AAC.1